MYERVRLIRRLGATCALAGWLAGWLAGLRVGRGWVVGAVIGRRSAGEGGGMKIWPCVRYVSGLAREGMGRRGAAQRSSDGG